MSVDSKAVPMTENEKALMSIAGEHAVEKGAVGALVILLYDARCEAMAIGGPTTTGLLKDAADACGAALEPIITAYSARKTH